MSVDSQTLNFKPGVKAYIRSEIAAGLRLFVEFGPYGSAEYLIPLGQEVVLTAGTEPFRITLDESNVDRSIRLVD
jgi:hypothetical protein